MTFLIVINRRYKVDFDSGLVINTETGQQTTLGGNEIAMLLHMVKHPNQQLKKEELLDTVWSSKGVMVEGGSLLRCISNCRKALEDKDNEIIRTIRGYGYEFTGSVEESFDCETTSPEELPLRLKTAAIIFMVCAAISFGVTQLISDGSPAYEVHHFRSCVVVDSSKKEAAFSDVDVFTVNDNALIVDRKGHSLSYEKGDSHVQCQ